jgi:hypothetical protein
MDVAETAAQWEAQRAAVVQRMIDGGGKVGLAGREMTAGKSGLELLQAMLRGELPFPYIAETMDFSLIEVDAGRAVFQGTPQLKHYISRRRKGALSTRPANCTPTPPRHAWYTKSRRAEATQRYSVGLLRCAPRHAGEISDRSKNNSPGDKREPRIVGDIAVDRTCVLADSRGRVMALLRNGTLGISNRVSDATPQLLNVGIGLRAQFIEQFLNVVHQIFQATFT